MSYGETFSRGDTRGSPAREAAVSSQDNGPSSASGGYGDAYSCAPTKRGQGPCESAVERLCHEYGYGREEWECFELESKITVAMPRGISAIWKPRPNLSLGESLRYPEPYSLDKVLAVSEASHSCYAFCNEPPACAFTKVARNDGTKMKVKGVPEYVCVGDIMVIKREESHAAFCNDRQISEYISDFARKSRRPIALVGSFDKKSKEAFIYNPASGRVFVAATNICEHRPSGRSLCQLEVEYYGLINGFVPCGTPFDEIAALIGSMLTCLGSRGYHAVNSTETKFDWLMRYAG